MQQPGRAEKPVNIYRNFAMDSSRWEKFTPRDGDIIIATPPKCGTTWTQMICALLIFQKTDFGRPLSDITPWLDMRMMRLDAILEEFESQTHRRFIKTHTPFDGLPYYENVTYLCVGRDPRDAFMSFDSHDRNISQEFKAKMLGALKPGDPRPAPPIKDLRERFRAWIVAPGTPESSDNPAMMPVQPFVKSFWDYRHLPNIHFVHYSDMKRDLGAEMRRIAKILGISVAEELWPRLIEAAQFESMKKKAGQFAPDAKVGIWRDDATFFNSGEVGQWQGVLGPEELELFSNTLRERLSPELARWIEHGSLEGMR